MAGTLVALCVPLAGACNWTVVQHAHAKGHEIDLVPAVLIGAAISPLVTLPLAWPFQANAHDIGLLAFLGLIQLAIPCVLSVICARVLKAPEVALLALLEVIFGIALAWIGAGEVPASQRADRRRAGDRRAGVQRMARAARPRVRPMACCRDA